MAANHQWPSTCTDTQLSIVADSPAAVAIHAAGSAPAVAAPAGRRRRRSKRPPVEDGSFAADVPGVDLQDPVQLCFAGAPLPVPGPGADVHVVVRPRARRRRGPCWSASGPAGSGRGPDQQHRTVLAPRVVLFVRHPGPDDFARFRGGRRGGRVADLGRPRKSPGYSVTGHRPGRQPLRRRLGRAGVRAGRRALGRRPGAGGRLRPAAARPGSAQTAADCIAERAVSSMPWGNAYRRAGMPARQDTRVWSGGMRMQAQGPGRGRL